MNFLFAWRYFKAKKTTNAINIIAWISIMAIVIGTAALILVLSVFNGFEGLVKSLYSSFYPDLKISPATGKMLTLTPEQLQKIRGVGGIRALSRIVEERALLQNRAFEADSADYQSIIYLKGVDEEYTKVAQVASHIVEGQFNTGNVDSPLLVLGAGIQNAVSVSTESNIRPLALYMPRKGSVDLQNPLNSLSGESVQTSGTFVIQQDFDNRYALTNMEFVKRMMAMDADQYSSVELSASPESVEDAQAAIQALLGKNYRVETRYQQNASLYSVMKVEKWIIYAILSLILVVAAFNMVGALTMLVLEKKADIRILHSLGGSRSFIQRIFLSEGLLLAGIGGGMGMLIAGIIGWLQTEYHLISLQGSTFMIEYFPVKMVPGDFLLVGATVFVIALIASWIPARKAAMQRQVVREE